MLFDQKSPFLQEEGFPQWHRQTQRHTTLMQTQRLNQPSWPILCKVFYLKHKQGQGNQCQAPAVKFEEYTTRKMEETGREGKVSDKTRELKQRKWKETKIYLKKRKETGSNGKKQEET